MNVIAGSFYAQCNADENEYLPLDSFVNYQRIDKVLTLDHEKIVVYRKPFTCCSTAGLKFCSLWMDRSTFWKKLKDHKESYPVKVVQYAVAQSIDHKQAFNYWVNHVLRKGIRSLL